MTSALVTEYLTNIINKVKTQNKNIKIFVASLLPNYYFRNQNWFDDMYYVMRTVAINNDCYFVDLTKFSSCKDDTVYSQGHLTALGYEKEADELIAYISYIISQNIDDFKYIQFIGTDYLYNE